jgi:hypothetical protein
LLKIEGLKPRELELELGFLVWLKRALYGF